MSENTVPAGAVDYDRNAAEGRLCELVDRIISEAKRQGADSVEASASGDQGLSVNVRRGDIETVEHTQERGFGVTVYRHTAEGVCKGSASTADDRGEAIAETVRAACNIAKYTQPDPCSGLADKALMATDLPDLDLLHPWIPEVGGAESMAVACEDAALSHDERITNSEGAAVNAHVGSRAYGNSHGFLAAVSGSRASLSCMVIGQDSDGMQRDYWYTVARNSGDLEAAGDVGRTAAQRTVARLGSRPIATGRYPVLMAPNLAAGLVGNVLSAISGSAQYRKSSYLVDSIGKAVMSSHISLREDPFLPRAMGSATFDGDGVGTRAQAFIQDGVVNSYVLGSYSARRLGLETTANSGGVHNLHVDSNTMPFSGLLKEMGTGLYVTELMGQGVNLLTGDYSRGASGFWIENGEIQHAVEEITIAGTLQDMLTHIVAFGEDVDTRGNTRCGSVLLEEMMVAAS